MARVGRWLLRLPDFVLVGMIAAGMVTIELFIILPGVRFIAASLKH